MSILGDSRQGPLFDVRRFVPEPYPAGSFYDTLERYGELIIQRDDFPRGADPSLGGNEAWCPVLKTKLVLIQRFHGWDDRETVQRATTDLQVKACLGLGVDEPGPSQPTLVRHRQRMEEQKLHEVYMGRFVELVKALELVDIDEPVAMDTVPIDGAGQTLDTFNLLAAGIRKGLQRLARVLQRPVEEVAAEMSLTAYLSRSIKGSAGIDWSSEAERRGFLQQLVDDARHLQAAIKNGIQPKEHSVEHEGSEAEVPGEDDDDNSEPDGSDSGGASTNRCVQPTGEADVAKTGKGVMGSDAALIGMSQCLDSIIAHDVEFESEGLVKGIRQRAANDRLISVTDPEMRHGRKSASQIIAGFKAQIVASVAHGWILLVKVIAANRHDGRDLPALMDGVERHGLHPRAYLGDHAYGLLDNHRYVQQRNAGNESHVELIARNARPSNGGRFTKDEFDIDLSARLLTCPAGQSCTSRWYKPHGEKGWLFEFPSEVCACCALKESCVNPKADARTVFVVPETEKLIRAHLQRRQQPDFIELLAKRQVVERANAGFAQCGGKVAHRFGKRHVEFDATLSALAHNLRTLGGLLARRPKLRQKVDQTAAAKRLFLLSLSILHALFSQRHRDAWAGTTLRCRPARSPRLDLFVYAVWGVLRRSRRPRTVIG
jgi:hypothetical protein